MEKMAGERARFGRESHALGAMLRFDGIHFRRDFLVSLLPANHLPFTVAAWPGAFHRFYNPLRVIDQADAAPAPGAYARPLLRRRRIALDKNGLVIDYLRLNRATKGTHFAQTWR